MKIEIMYLKLEKKMIEANYENASHMEIFKGFKQAYLIHYLSK